MIRASISPEWPISELLGLKKTGLESERLADSVRRGNGLYQMISDEKQLK